MWQDTPEILPLFNATFPAKITAVTAGSGALAGYYLYSWTEQTLDVNGLYVDAHPGRSGTGTTAYAFEVNNTHLTTFPFYTELRVRGSTGGITAYEFNAGQSSGAQFVKPTTLTRSAVTLPGGRTVTDGVLNGTTTLTSATANFTAGDVGLTLVGNGIPIGTKISGRTNSTTVTMSAAATTSTTGVTVTIGGISAYGAKLEAWSNTTGQWSDGATVWFAPANNETLQEVFVRYMCQQMGADASGVAIYERDVVVLSGAQLAQGNDQSIPDSTLTKITTTAFNTLYFDTDGFTGSAFGGTFNTGSKGAVFLITINVRWDNNSVGERVLQAFDQNGLNLVASDIRSAVNGDFTDQSLSFVYPNLIVGSTHIPIDFYAYQSSGGALSLVAPSGSGTLVSLMSIVRLG